MGGGGGGGGGGRSQNFFGARFGPQFGLKIRGEPGPRPPSLDPPLFFFYTSLHFTSLHFTSLIL